MSSNEKLIDKIRREGFVFVQYDPSEILALETDYEKLNALKDVVASILSIDGETIYADMDILEKGEEIKPHYHVVMGSFQAVTWIPESDDFKGRDFLFGTPDSLNEFRPTAGIICFMKPNDTQWVHGVSELLTDTKIRSFGFTSSLVPIDKQKNDVFC